MWKKPGTRQPLHPSQLVVGLFIELDVSWDDHPFFTNRFKIRSGKQIATLAAMQLEGKLYYYPDKSAETPLERPPLAAIETLEPEADLSQEIAQQNEEKHQQLRKLQDAAARADRAWEQAAKATREALNEMNRSPKQAGKQLLELSRQTAKLIAEGDEVLLHLLGDKAGEGPQFHALNTMTLAMLLGKFAGLNEAQLSELALGVLAHDIGKTKVPPHIVKAKTRARHEEAFYREHGAFGVQMAKFSDAFGPLAISIIADHHEYLDGSGWPTGKKNAGPAARIAALVDRYDELCSPESNEREALMPAEVLARMYKVESAKFDPSLLSLLIKLLGVYPPGTLVRLNDESLALVVSPGKDSLRPTVLVYSPEMDRREAPTIDLAHADDLKIEEAVRPSSLPPDVLKWMNPRQRLSYFFSADKS